MTTSAVAPELLEAVMFAADRHRNQRCKDAEASPYINHPIALAHLLATVGAVDDLDVLRAAILHDTVEDTETSEVELRERFGDAVTGMVMEVTDDKTLPKQRRKELQVEHVPHKSQGATLVKLADKTCNHVGASLSEILCARHNMSTRSMNAKQDKETRCDEPVRNFVCEA